MFKKTGLILLVLTLATGMVFVGCGDSGGGGGVDTVVFQLSTNAAFQALTTSATKDQAFQATGDFLEGVGENAASTGVVVEDGKNALRFVIPASTDWGAGIRFIDVGKFNFTAGDTLQITGKINAIGNATHLFLDSGSGGTAKTVPGSNTAISNGESFSINVTLTAGDVSDIKASTDKKLKLRPAAETGSGLSFTITEILYTGIR